MVRAKTNDRIIFNQNFLQSEYFASGFEIKGNDVVIDIGAHIGFFSIYAASKAKNGKVYAFEPAPDNLEMLRKNIELNKLNNVKIVNAAIAAEEGVRDFILYPRSHAANSFVYSATEEKNIIKVATVNLGKFVERENINRIDFLKIDSEGAEYEILFGLRPDEFRKIKKISMEYHEMDERRNVKTLAAFLEQNGFKTEIKTRGDNMLYAQSKT